MEMFLSYQKRSRVETSLSGIAVSLSPNLRRDRVSYSGTLKDPLRFREAMSALHDVVINDLRFKKRDKSAYVAFKAAQNAEDAVVRRTATQQRRAELKSAQTEPMPVGLESDYRNKRALYWKARQAYSDYLLKHDRELWRYMMPCDPVITVAEDKLFFECFSADESSYGCLSVDRDGMHDGQQAELGTTNVDYSWGLYEHFQRLRSYRETRFEIDPSGFEVAVADAETHREEKIDLPNTWLRGFMQLQSAMAFPQRRVPVSREGLYNVLAFLRRSRAKTSPRALRFQLKPGKPPVVILEPWEKAITLSHVPYQGPEEMIRTWGRDRLHVLGRQLPLIDRAEVCLLGTGMPSFWISRMGPLQMVLGLSGWTTNNWTSASALSQLMPPVELAPEMIRKVANSFADAPAMSFSQIQQKTQLPEGEVAASLNQLALLGQVIHDLTSDCFRWRQVMPAPLAGLQIGDENRETLEAKRLMEGGRVQLRKDSVADNGLVMLNGIVDGREVEVIISEDGRMVRGSCACSHHFKNGLRMGPCRHLQALRNKRTLGGDSSNLLNQWYKAIWNGGGN